MPQSVRWAYRVRIFIAFALSLQTDEDERLIFSYQVVSNRARCSDVRSRTDTSYSRGLSLGTSPKSDEPGHPGETEHRKEGAERDHGTNNTTLCNAKPAAGGGYQRSLCFSQGLSLGLLSEGDQGWVRGPVTTLFRGLDVVDTTRFKVVFCESFFTDKSQIGAL